MILINMAPSALSIASGRAVSILFGVFVSMLAMCFLSIVWRHGQTFPENTVRRIEHFFKRSTSFRALNNGVGFKSGYLRQDCGLILYACDRYHSSRTSIQHLISSRCPATISQFIMSIVVDSFQSKTDWSLAHILNKCRKTTYPPFAYPDAATAIIFECRIFWIEAPLLNSKPCGIEGMPTHIMFAIPAFLAWLVHAPIMPREIKISKEISCVV